MEYEFRAEYTELSESVEQYAADILAQARDSEEVSLYIFLYRLKSLALRWNTSLLFASFFEKARAPSHFSPR